ncbi:MAG: thermonuclease family protein [Hyphomicrobium sp.]
MTTLTPTSFQLGRASLAAGALFCLSLAVAGIVWAGMETPSQEPASFSGPATVVDGDTIDIGGQRIRLEGIDAPETAQTCQRADGRTWPCGRRASSALAKLIGGQEVVCDSRGSDKYRRRLAVCFAKGQDINAAMVKAGMAWAFVRYSDTYTAEESQARQALAGVWQGPAEAPWEFRHKGWSAAQSSAPNGCAIKGNVSNKGHIYHMPWSPWYRRVTIEADRGERWFCSETEAQAAGWRPAFTL